MLLTEKVSCIIPAESGWVVGDFKKSFIIYEEQHSKGHIYRTISHVCHNKIVCPLGNFVACDWLS